MTNRNKPARSLELSRGVLAPNFVREVNLIWPPVWHGVHRGENSISSVLAIAGLPFAPPRGLNAFIFSESYQLSPS